MSKMIAVRLRDETLSRVDRERRRAGLTRAAAIHEALELWVSRRQYEQAILRDQEGYAQNPVDDEEFAAVLGAQVWPK